jgi:hypothetical protein
LPFIEHRKSARKRVIRSAKLIFNHDGTTNNCIVFDQSDDGALIELDDAIPVPPDVTLLLSTGSTYLARRRWQRKNRLGVQFSNRQTAQTDTSKSLHIFATILDNYGQSVAARTLRSTRHNNDEDSGRVAEDAEATEAELTSILAAIKKIC